VDAEEAERSGLVSRVVPVKRLMEVTLDVAAKIAEKSQISIKAVKDSVNRSYETTLAEGLLFERRVFHSMFATDDQKEGMAAFVEKREPKFRDK
jgi:enoyl-CoA hydratase